MRVRPSDQDPEALDVDAVIVTHFQGEPLGPGAARVDRATDGAPGRMRTEGDVLGKFAERAVIQSLGRLPARRVLLLGLGEPGQLDGYRLRNALQLAVRQLRRYCRTLAVVVDPGVVDALAGSDPLQGTAPAVARAVAEAVVLGGYQVAQQRSTGVVGEITELELVGLGTGAEIADALAQGADLGEATNRTRRLQWTPGNHLTPTLLAAEAERVATAARLEFEVLERADMERLGMGALLSVARGSHEPPKLVCLGYRPKRAAGAAKRLALVGKGITFDTGGISLKPNAGMVAMKADMSGAGAVIEAMGLISAMEAPIEVIGVAALTENMPGGGATKPGDVVTAMNGKTIEINNTDAEGRLVLADALGYAAQKGATHLVDAATLTGSAVVAMGYPVSAAMGTSPELLAQLRRAGALAGERIWELPLFPEYDLALSSDIADMRNTSGTTASGAINAAVFLREFISGLPWVHLDIAGTAYHTDSHWDQAVPRGPAGVMTRTFAHLPFEMV